MWPNCARSCGRCDAGRQRQVWAGALSGGRTTVALWNRAEIKGDIVAHWEDLGFKTADKYTVTDVWSGKQLGTFSSSFTTTVDAYDTALLVLTPA